MLLGHPNMIHELAADKAEVLASLVFPIGTPRFIGVINGLPAVINASNLYVEQISFHLSQRSCHRFHNIVIQLKVGWVIWDAVIFWVLDYAAGLHSEVVSKKRLYYKLLTSHADGHNGVLI